MNVRFSASRNDYTDHTMHHDDDNISTNTTNASNNTQSMMMQQITDLRQRLVLKILSDISVIQKTL